MPELGFASVLTEEEYGCRERIVTHGNQVRPRRAMLLLQTVLGDDPYALRAGRRSQV
jgi:hypothetical protein